MAYAEIDADALIDRLIDRLIAAEQRNAGASYIEAMQKYELMRAEHESVSKMLAVLQNAVEADRPKLTALWKAATVANDRLRRLTAGKEGDTNSLAVLNLDQALKAACDVCDGDPIPY